MSKKHTILAVFLRPKNRGKTGEKYAYDLNGNRLKKEHFKNGIVDAAEACCYNERNELTQKSDASGLVSYLYDANGNLLSERTKKEASEYRYDLLNRQTCVHITDPQENVENSYWYDAFGNVLESREIIQNRMLYTGQQYDQVTGQYYLRARYYNPVMGRFTQEDTYRGDGLNLYAYCANNPVVYYDPSGHQPATNACGKGSTEEPKKDPAQVVSEGVEGGTVPNTLTNAQKSRLKTLDNTIEHNLKDTDFSGTLRDLQGNPVPDTHGGFYDHLTEMRQSYSSLTKIRRGLEGSLRNPNLSNIDRTILQEGLDKANAYIQRIEQLFEPFGGVN